MVRKNSNQDSNTGSIFAYHGADDVRKRKALDELIESLVEADFRDFDCERLYGPDITADRLILACSVLPFASKKRVVVVTQANDISTSEQQSLATRLKQIPESACLVLVSPAPALQDGKPKRGSELHSDLVTALRKVGKIVDFPVMKTDPAIRFVLEQVSHAGKTIAPSIAALVVNRCGTDSGVLVTEVEKLASYIGDRTAITDADVQEVTTQTVEEKIFSLLDAVGTKNPKTALSYLRPLLYGGGNAQGEALRILVMLARHFRQLWQARVFMDAGCKRISEGTVPEDVLASLPQDGSILKMEDWKRNKIIAQARNFTQGSLKQSFEKMAAVDMAIKGIGGALSDPAMATELLIIELSSREESKKGRAYAPSL